VFICVHLWPIASLRPELTVAQTIVTMDPPAAHEIPEADLLRWAQSGSPDALEQLIMRHERKIFALALRITGSVADAQDAAQETFIRLHLRIREIDAQRGAGPWLCTVVVNACRDIGRRRQRSRLIPMPPAASEVPDALPDPERRFSARESEQCLRAGLATLPEKERAALLLREMEGLTTAEVARTLGSSEVTVRSQICNARLKLRRFFRRHEEATR
jgi:RNA polymerase sigma-70 factor (ECF subfamily)